MKFLSSLSTRHYVYIVGLLLVAVMRASFTQPAASRIGETWM